VVLLPPSSSQQPSRLFWDCGVNNGRMVGEAYGCAADTCVLLLHGGGQTKHSWTNTCLALVKAGFFAVAVDWKGHGESYWDPDAGYHVPSFAADLDRLCAMIGVPKPMFLVGASLGGLAILGSKVGQAGKDVLAGVVLVDVAPKLEVGGVHRVMDFLKDRAASGFKTLEEVAQTLAGYQSHRGSSTQTTGGGGLEGLKKNLRFNSALQRWFWHWDPKFMRQDHPTAEQLQEMEAKLLASASHVKCPVLLIRGQLTDMVSDEGVRTMQNAVPQAQLVDVRNAAHMVAGDNNDAFTAALLKFLMGGGARL
jgi:pimeloyl-ACP methyl ester carboxylesterase